MNLDDFTLDIEQHIEIHADASRVFEAMLCQLGEENAAPGGKPMPMRLERYPGGRWYRDLGHDTGHLGGFVQVIKPPTLLEICGPMFMSYPVAGHLTLRLKTAEEKTHVQLRHRVFGMVEDEHRQNITPGWEYFLKGRLREHLEGTT